MSHKAIVLELKEKISIFRQKCERLLFNSMHKVIYAGLVLSIIITILILSDYKPFVIDCSGEKADKINDLMLALSWSYMASFIFYLVQDFWPHYTTRKTNSKYVRAKINEINTKLRYEVSRHFFFEIPTRKEFTIEEYVNKFVDDDLFIPISKTIVKSRYEELKEDCLEIKKIVEELLIVYGSYLTYDEMMQLEYLNDYYAIDPLLASHYTSFNSKEEFLKAQAINIYKAYAVMQGKRFKVPHYTIEDKLKADLGLV